MNAKDTYGRTALQLASENSNHDAARMFVEHNADVNAKDTDGRTALHWAAEKKIMMQHRCQFSTLQM